MTGCAVQVSLFWMSLFAALFMLVLALFVYSGFKQIKHLEAFSGYDSQDLLSAPSVTIIVSALNEAQTIQPALLSMLALEYPILSIIAINDRSTDETGAVLDALSQEQIGNRLKVIHIDTLPAGWLGKSHALQQGATQAHSDYLLFTDADVVFDRQAISRAVRYCETKQIDHLSLFFDIVARSALLQMLIISFSVGLMARFQPWRVATSTKHYFGVGAFNLIRRSVYVDIGGHAHNPMAVIDDIKLGELVKSKGYKQDALFGLKSVSVEWYPSVRALVRGLEKNLFSGFDHSVALVAAASVFTLVVRVWPWIGLFVMTGPTRYLCLIAALTNVMFCAALLHGYKWSYRCILFLPIVGVVEMYIWWRATILTLIRGGVTWRGHFYPLAEIKKGRLSRYAK